MKNDNYDNTLGPRPISQIDIQCNIVDFVVDCHIYYMKVSFHENFQIYGTVYSGTFCQEKSFENFTTISHWQNFLSCSLLSSNIMVAFIAVWIITYC